MNGIDALIESHEQIIERLRGIKELLITAPDATMILRDCIAYLSHSSYATVELKISCGGDRLETEWRIYDGAKSYQASTLADAFRSMSQKISTLDEVVKELS